jgi:hypothetical protein
MGVTYDMMSNQEIDQLLMRETRRTAQVKAPQVDRTSYVQRISQEPAPVVRTS